MTGTLILVYVLMHVSVKTPESSSKVYHGINRNVKHTVHLNCGFTTERAICLSPLVSIALQFRSIEISRAGDTGIRVWIEYDG